VKTEGSRGKVPEMTRRSRYDIVAKILSVAQDGARSTRIMYKSNLDFRQNKRYLDHLLAAGLIRVKTNSPPVYETTEFGIRWLENYRKITL